MAFEMFDRSGRSSSSLEVALIFFTFLCLPLFEAPKNIFSVVFLVIWVVEAFRTRSLGRHSVFEWPIFGLVAVLWLAPLFSAYGGELAPFNSSLRWTLLGFFGMAAARLDFSRSQLLIIWVGLLLGGVLAVAESFWVWSHNGKLYPEFRSVGHVNHSSMYTIITLAAGLGALYLRQRWFQMLGLVAVISTLAFLPPSGSVVGGVAILTLLIFGFSVYVIRRWSFRRLPIAILIGVMVVGIVLALPLSSDFRIELVSRFTGDNIFSGRDKILYSALVVWDQHTLLGTGWSSFGVATSEEVVRAALEAEGLEYDPDVYWHYSHGHNLWTTMLIERGLVGVVLVSVLLLLYFRMFLRIIVDHDLNEPTDLGISVGAFLVALGFFVSGLGNTTMMNEHGHAGMAFIAVAYGYLRGRGLLGATAGARRQV